MLKLGVEFGAFSALTYDNFPGTVDQQSLYHCPNSRCEKEFKTLAAICNHLESESCKFARFQQVQSSFRDLISSDRLLGF